MALLSQNESFSNIEEEHLKLFLCFFQDELETTKRSYEEQLRTLSDHLCGMNEKLTSQKDQIDELKITGGNNPGGQKPAKFQLPGRKK